MIDKSFTAVKFVGIAAKRRKDFLTEGSIIYLFIDIHFWASAVFFHSMVAYVSRVMTNSSLAGITNTAILEFSLLMRRSPV